jgi:hypothetical protein
MTVQMTIELTLLPVSRLAIYVQLGARAHPHTHTPAHTHAHRQRRWSHSALGKAQKPTV